MTREPIITITHNAEPLVVNMAHPEQCPTCATDGSRQKPFDGLCPAAWAHQHVKRPRPSPAPTSPALSPEEWAEFDGPAGLYHDDVEDRPPALAALCLHGQPFGFTQEDVDALRAAAFDAWGIGDTAGDARLLSLADRIAALLPPA